MKTLKKEPTFPIIVSEHGVSAKVNKITQTKNGKTYTVYVVNYVLLGQRKQVGRSDLAEAKQVALEACRKIATGQQMSLTLSNDDRLIYLRATEALVPVKTPLDMAAQEFATAHQILGGKISIAEACRDWIKRNAIQLPQISVSAAVEQLKKQAELDGKSAARRKQLNVLLTRFAENFGVDVHTITPSLIADYLSRLALAERSKKNHRDVIGYFNRWLVLRGYLGKGTNWLENVQSYSARKLSEIEIYTPAELAVLLRSSGDMTPFIAIAAFAGLRHAEISRLEWSEIDLEDGFIEVRASKAKTGERRLVPIHDNLKQWLLPYRQSSGKIIPYSNTGKQLLKIAKVAGIEWKHNGLRHSFISYRVAECSDVPRVSDEAGNSPQMIRQHYLRRVKPAAASQWFRIVPYLPDIPETTKIVELAVQQQMAA